MYSTKLTPRIFKKARETKPRSLVWWKWIRRKWNEEAKFQEEIVNAVHDRHAPSSITSTAKNRDNEISYKDLYFMRLTKIKKNKTTTTKSSTTTINFYGFCISTLTSLLEQAITSFLHPYMYLYASSLHLNYIHIPLFIMGTLTKLFTTQNWFE